MRASNTAKALDYAMGLGILPAEEPEEAAKRIPHQVKMILLRRFNDLEERSQYRDEKFEDYIRETIRPILGHESY